MLFTHGHRKQCISSKLDFSHVLQSKSTKRTFPAPRNYCCLPITVLSLLSSENCLLTSTVEYFISVWSVYKIFSMFSFVSNLFNLFYLIYLMFESLAQSLCHLATVPTVFAVAWTVAHQVPLSMGFPSKNTGVVCHFLLQGIFQSWDWIWVSCISCAGRQSLYHWATREALSASHIPLQITLK